MPTASVTTWVVAAAVGLLFYFWSDQFLAPPDCAFYWAWADVLLHGPSLNFLPEFQKLHIPNWYGYITETGRMANDWPMGTGLLLLPAAWAGAAWAHAWEAALLVLVLSLWWRTAAGTPLPRAFSLAGLVLGTPLLFYALFGPFFSHIASFIVVTGFLVLWNRSRESTSARHWLLSGLLLGFATLIRPQNALLCIVYLADICALTDEARADFRGFSRKILLPLLAGLLLGLAPRFSAYAVLYGSPLALPKLEEMQWFSPHVSKTLFSDYHGILPWTPIYAVGFLGLLLGLRCRRRLCTGLLLVFVVQFYINAANQVWWSGGSFGNRRLTDYSIVVAWGLLILMSQGSRSIKWCAGAATILCCAWTFTLLLAERRLILPLDRYVPFSTNGFFGHLADVYLQPKQTWESLTRAVSGAEFKRGAAAALLFITTGAAGSALHGARVSIRGRTVCLVAVLCQAVLALWVTVAALQTPPVDAEVRAQFGRSSAILWDNYTELAGYHLVREEFSQADKTARRAITIRPDAPTGHWYSGVALLRLGEPGKAADRFSEVLKLDPAHHNARELLQLAQRQANFRLPEVQEKPASQPDADWRVK